MRRGIFEQLQAGSVVGLDAMEIPLGMILWEKIGFGMRHQAEDAAGGIAQPRDGIQ